MKITCALLIATSALAGCVTYESTGTEGYPRVSTARTLPVISPGISLTAYPELVVVFGTPVYYAPQVDANYFFYDGLYWVFQGDNWYASSWYNGPWDLVGREYVPLFVLRVPVRYYRRPPPYFRGWRPDAPPRWAEHWGRDWEQRRSGWDQWDRRPDPPPAPLPVYQRQYSGDRYPRAPQQQYSIRSEQYRYQPLEPITQQRFQQREQSTRHGYQDQQLRQEQERLQQRQQQQEQERLQQRQQQQEQERLQQRQQQQEQERLQQRQQQQEQERLQQRQQQQEQERLQQRQQQQEQERPQQQRQLEEERSQQKRQQEQIDDRRLMTPKETAEYRAKMRAARTSEEQEKIRKEHNEMIKERAKARGLTPPD